MYLTTKFLSVPSHVYLNLWTNGQCLTHTCKVLKISLNDVTDLDYNYKLNKLFHFLSRVEYIVKKKVNPA